MALVTEELVAMRAAVAAGDCPWGILRDALLDAGLADDAAMRADMLRRKGWKWRSYERFVDHGAFKLGTRYFREVATCTDWSWACWRGRQQLTPFVRCEFKGDGRRAAEQWLLEHGY